MKFKDLTECPFCGYDEFFTKTYVCGPSVFRERFDGEEAENGDMYDGVITKRYSGRCYCDNCRRYIGNRDSGIVPKSVQKALAERSKNETHI